MKKIEVQGLGVFVEVFKRKDILTDLEMLREAIKTLQREVLRVESSPNSHISGQSNSNSL